MAQAAILEGTFSLFLLFLLFLQEISSEGHLLSRGNPGVPPAHPTKTALWFRCLLPYV
jgi:hypothetical protein